MIIGAFLSGTGTHPGSWRLPDVDANASRNFETYRRIVTDLEKSGVTLAFLNDIVAITDLDARVIAHDSDTMRWDPIVLLAALSASTSRIGLVATANTSYNHPYNLARSFASLDQISQGRIGWNLVTSVGGGENFGLDEHMEHASRYERAEEFIDVVRRLWDSWDDGAFVQDKERGVWLQPEKLNVTEYSGKHFRVKGPLISARPVQGHPVIAQAGASEPGKRLAARTAELVFTAARTIEEARRFSNDLRSTAREFGRSPDSMKILPGVTVFLGETKEAAQAYFDSLHALANPYAALKALSAYVNIGVDLHLMSLDDRIVIPDIVPETNVHKSRQKLVIDMVRRERPTVRQLYKQLAAAGGHRVIIGTPDDVCDALEEWFRADVADGFNFLLPDIGKSVDDLTQLLMPALRARGLVPSGYAGATLRDHLGLLRPVAHASTCEV
ncbi:LLM class flavin-dependent oxidoreductase [Paraburkholderia sp. A1RI_3L]|uniref:LLM class flavin-dependent oxidoreductase n=1 Tax=Paraburkholderia TaxID=1822464 RepID=UPI0018F6C03D|nr:LLM class flavin-dependent oxidoreductase [Paraburkholderia kururiensis]